MEQLLGLNSPKPFLAERTGSLEIDTYLLTFGVQNLSNSTAFTIPTSFSNQILRVPQATTNNVLTLPTAALGVGCTFKFRFAAAGDTSHTWTIQTTGNENTLFGVVTLGPSTMTQLALPGHHTIVSSASIAAGDYLDIQSDGTSWWVSGASSVASGFTSSA